MAPDYFKVLQPMVAWSADDEYLVSIVQVAGITAFVSCPHVSHLGVAYQASGDVQPTPGVAPATDTAAWTKLYDIAA